MGLPKLTLVLGGAASGKSAFAERLVQASGAPPLYIATAQPLDAEMRAKIDRHRTRRGQGWQTVEAPLDPAPALAAAGTGAVVLFDCATMWLGNHMLAGHDIAVQQDALIAALGGCPAPVVIVSNEVGLSIVPDNALARRFREAQGRLNQRLAAEAGLVINVIAGLPQVLKGHWP